MASMLLDLNGYTDLPPGRIANVVTFFEMKARSSQNAAPLPAGLVVRHVERPDVADYRDLYRRIGEPWLWFSRAILPHDELAAMLAQPSTEIYFLERDGIAIGLAELHRDLSAGDVEIAMFGVVPEATGTGAARGLMAAVLGIAWTANTERVWLHTCSFDHPAAVRFYQKCGFRAFKFAIEVSEDPRLQGFLPRTAGPHVALIEPD